MKKKTNKFSKEEKVKFEEFLIRHLVNIQDCGNLNHFNLHSLGEKKEDGSGMSIIVDHKYLDFYLNYHESWAKQNWDLKNYTNLIQYLCHELTHIIINEVEDQNPPVAEIADKVSFYLERSTEHTSRWLYRLYLQSMKDRKIDIRTGKRSKK